jgi:hypothetical protein
MKHRSRSWLPAFCSPCWQWRFSWGLYRAADSAIFYHPQDRPHCSTHRLTQVPMEYP